MKKENSSCQKNPFYHEFLWRIFQRFKILKILFEKWKKKTPIYRCYELSNLQAKKVDFARLKFFNAIRFFIFINLYNQHFFKSFFQKFNAKF